MKKFSDLPGPIQDYINERFSNHGISGAEAYELPHLFPDELKARSPMDIRTVLEKKEISHIMPKSKYPELADKAENVILEDKNYNRARSDEVMQDYEKNAAMDDLLEDLNDGDVDEDGIIDLSPILEKADDIEMHQEILGGSIFGGLVFTGVEVYDKIKKKEISVEEVPHFFVYRSGGRTIKLAIIGTLLSTGNLIIVGGTTAYILYKSKKMLKSVYNVIISEKYEKKIADFYNSLGQKLDKWLEKQDIADGMYNSDIIPIEIKLASADFKNRNKA